MSTLGPILRYLIQPQAGAERPILPLDFSSHPDEGNPAAVCRSVNAAFLIGLAGEPQADLPQARALLDRLAASARWGDLARFHRDGLVRIEAELQERLRADAGLAARLRAAEEVLCGRPSEEAAAEAVWSVLCPEAAGIRGRESLRIAALREKRIVQVRRLNPDPIRRPLEEILFTSNALLTTPLAGTDLRSLGADFEAGLAAAAHEPQRYWFDHPVPLGVPDANNEILYGLTRFDEAVGAEQERYPEWDGRTPFVLSVSVTHEGLRTLGRPYLERVLADAPLERLDVYAFTEADSTALVERVLLPVAHRCCPSEDAAGLLSVFGVDGRYGRHYSFLKAIAAIWQVLVDPRIRATFKIDLDQVFPQAELAAQTGNSAFEHFTTPLWGAQGLDASGRPVELGMIAGALVNQDDIHRGLFTPDVPFPRGRLEADEYVFFSRLPQALSTQAEMMTRYAPGAVPDGQATCLQRVHVTGGTNGILVDALRRFRPFTPGFVGRAEDQAYLLSTLDEPGGLAGLHASGLFMRHDKEGFAREAIGKARVGSRVGDLLRILVFSAYAGALDMGVEGVKERVDPFTGSFITRLPVTAALTRFALQAAVSFGRGRDPEALEFVQSGARQLEEALGFTASGAFERTLHDERRGWDLFYRCLSAAEAGLGSGEAWAAAAREEARAVVSDCRLALGRGPRGTLS